MKTGNKNQRKSDRVKPTQSQSIEVQIMGTGHLDVLPARDISTSGIGVRVAHRFEGCDLGSEVELVITLPKARSFMAYGIIRHWHGAEGDHFGVEFTGIDPKNTEQIRSYIKNCRAESKD